MQKSNIGRKSPLHKRMTRLNQKSPEEKEMRDSSFNEQIEKNFEEVYRKIKVLVQRELPKLKAREESLGQNSRL